jgi:hypothetical protein
MFPNIHGKPDGKNQEKRNMRKKVKQAISQNIGQEKLSSCELFTTTKTLDYQQHFECLSHLLL